jgi:site-specific DNA-methyltransferase (adenine-specific)
MFHPGRRPYPKSYIEGRFKGSDDKGLFRQQTLTGAGVSHGSSGEAWRGFDPTERGRHWAIAGSLKKLLPNGGENMTLQQKLDYLADQPDSAIEMPKSESGMPTYKQYIGTGVPYQDIWAYQPGTRGILFGTEDGIDEDVAWLEDGDEKTGFQTQKPRGLLKRIIESSTDTGQVVLDPFCGCGTAIAAAQSLRRRWVGIDITHVAVSIIRARLTADGVNPRTYEVVGLPKDEAGAEELFTQDPYQFQAWACGLAGVHPNMRDGKPQKGADQGIDGRLRYQEVDGTERLILAQVKGGKTSSRDIRDLSGTMRRQNATFGFFITLNDATKEMTKEAASVGTYRPAQASLTRSEPYMRLQVRTVKQLLDGEKFDYPAPH